MFFLQDMAHSRIAKVQYHTQELMLLPASNVDIFHITILTLRPLTKLIINLRVNVGQQDVVNMKYNGMLSFVLYPICNACIVYIENKAH